MKKSKKDIFSAFFVLNFIAFILCTILIISGKVAFSFNGFGVDSQGRLYVGRGPRIEVIEEEEIVQTISNRTGRSFVFTILENDLILLSTGSYVCTMDTSGSYVIEEWPDTRSETYYKLQRNKYEFYSTNGDKYTASRRLGLLTIYHESERIYQMPIFDYVVMVIISISAPLFLFSAFVVNRELRKKSQTS